MEMVRAPRSRISVDHRFEAIQHHIADHGRTQTPLRNSTSGGKQLPPSAISASQPAPQHSLVHGDMGFEPGEADVVEEAFAIPLQDLGRRGLLPQHLEALVNGISTPALGPKPVRIRVRRGFGNWR
jgi:hypothetical protein